MVTDVNITELLEYINPSELTYADWIAVGMVIKDEGHPCSIWDTWSRRDAGRYHPRECEAKWETFRGAMGSPVTIGTIIQMAQAGGWSSPLRECGHTLDWDDSIGRTNEELVVVNQHWLEGREFAEPESWHPAQQLITYLETLFEASETVGFVTRSYEKDGRYIPDKGCYTMTSGDLIHKLSRCTDGDIGAVLGDYSPAVGAWIRFNPLDGKGVKNENVTEYRYALVESDTLEPERQNAIIREMELPVACLVYSGGKSIHAIVRIDAADYKEYRTRVDYLYKVCEKNGFIVDGQNRNPSRLSRMPGVMRKGHKQFLIDTNIGKSSWAEWFEWIEGINDDLPEPENMLAAWDHLPELSPPLINGVLRQGHKMLVAGPSKAGKSYALIELCIAIAEGRRWLSWQCTQGKVLYVNLELDRASCLHRVRDVYEALRWEPKSLANIDIWNLRGKSIPMDKLAPKLIRRAAKKHYIAIIIDPIYKVITGDENSADQMARFCNQFDLVCAELNAAVIYCHHHSKGLQGQKRAMDRASGSGVFARDPDALLDLIQLDTTDALITQRENEGIINVCKDAFNSAVEDWEERVSQDEQCSAAAMIKAAQKLLGGSDYKQLIVAIDAVKAKTKLLTAWRIDGTLREFPKFEPVNMWFDYPIHYIDKNGALDDVKAEGDTYAKAGTWKQNFNKRKTPDERQQERKEKIDTAFDAVAEGGKAAVQDIATYLSVSDKTVRRRLSEHGNYWIDGGEVGRKDRDKVG